MTPRNETPKEVPKKIHIVWVGGPIPEKYLDEIKVLSDLAQSDGFELNLWVDNEKNFTSTLKKQVGQDVELPKTHAGIKIRNISELEKRIINDEFYKENNRGRDFINAVSGEMTGFINMAAAADLLRYEILRQEGGTYLDADTKIIFEQESKFIDETPLLGFRANMTHRSSNHDGKVFLKSFVGGNDIIVSQPDHEILRTVITTALEEYKNMGTQKYLATSQEDEKLAREKQLGFKINQDTTRADLKRFPYGVDTLVAPRRMATLQTTGPFALSSAMETFWKNHPEHHSPENLSSLTLDNNGLGTKTTFGIKVKSESDQVWLKKPATVRRSFDTDSIPHTLFGHGDSNQTAKAKIVDEKPAAIEENEKKSHGIK